MGYSRLTEHYRRLAHLGHIGAIVGWDDAVMRAVAGGAARAEALATLGALSHERRTDPRVAQWLDEAEAEPLSSVERANLREMRRDFVRATALPASLVEASSLAASRCEQAWREQRRKNDFAGHRPLLEEVVRLARERASVMGDALGLDPYDALLDEYEPGLRQAQVQPIFDTLADRLGPLLEQIEQRQATEEFVQPKGPFAIESQRALGLDLMGVLGFDFDRGRLDVSHHPFCGGVADDVRITTRYDPADFTSALMGVLHETGHAKYEQGLDPELRDQPVGLARSMAVHESQSLLTEMQVCRSPAFVRWLAPKLRTTFAEQATADPEAFGEDNLTRLYTRVRRGFIRVDADEVTYPFHVVLRSRLERALIDGSLSVRELPEAWDAGMRELLGLSTGDNHRDGCMQDVHWPSGAFGYFPTYTLGALLAAQLFAAARAQLPNLLSDIESGRFEALNDWLRERVWRTGSLYETPELIELSTGRSLSVEPFLSHLQERYLGR